ncbi:MAG: thioredoxin domain-containing protein [Planctomycetes bacterium]|nr:thioredoxin domain-containing protein [Planctomycetota bacterium]
MPNHLIHETSPYLLQHRNNPVDWYPWGSEAIENARKADKPIFLSIGYSACHWCHVMERECFENEAIARLFNDDFISIKVDREERPDLDHIYMNAVQMLTGRGGWPMSVFLTPDLKPFFGGTYWPPRASRGMPGFDQILAAVADAWKHRREQVLRSAEQITAELQDGGQVAGGNASALTLDLMEAAFAQLRHAFDHTSGGFGQAPKFPHPMDLQLLLRIAHRGGLSTPVDMVRLTLDRMASGGIYDHLGGGFARYSVDSNWLVPHFEKMLYDNALMAGTYLDAYLVTGDATYARVIRETLDYVLRDMTDPAGGFYSTEDADSAGREGLFYTWTRDEIDQVLGQQRGILFCRVYDISEVGNFEGRNILNLPKTVAQCAAILGHTPRDLALELADSRDRLFAAREKRVRPGRDDKVIVAWNGLMIDALARAGAALGMPRYVKAACLAAEFILRTIRRDDGRLRHTWRAGTAKLDAYLDDYASLANSLVSLYEATFHERWIDEATRLMDIVLKEFADSKGGFFYTAMDHEPLITRTKELTDSSLPSGNALAATALLRLGSLLGRNDYLEAAERALAAAVPIIERAPMATGQMLLALDRRLGPTCELVMVGDSANKDVERAISLVHRSYLPRSVVAFRSSNASSIRAISSSAGSYSSHLDDLFAGKSSLDGQPALYVCQNFTCQSPAIGLDSIQAEIDRLSENQSGS